MKSFAVAALALALAAPATEASTTSRPRAVNSYCKPSQPCWPSAADFATLNKTVGGRLVAVKPMSIPCYGANNTLLNLMGTLTCVGVSANYKDGTFRADQIGAVQLDNWGYCNSNADGFEDCSLDTRAPPVLGVLSTVDKVCKQGRIAPYGVQAQSGADVQAALAFAKAKNIRVVIKNTGHDYLGRSASKDSLMIWTHKLNSMSYSASFTPDSCASAGTFAAATLGAGVLAQDSLAFSETNKYSITHGAVGTVGVAGGFALGGGHGPMGPSAGLAVDNILQLKVVTADGEFRIANACQNSDLFWALRGGGGGTFGVVTEVTYRVYPESKWQSSTLLFSATNDDAVEAIVAEIALLQPAWYDAKMAGYFLIANGTVGAVQGLPSNNASEIKALIQPLVDWAAKRTDLKLLVNLFDTQANLNQFNTKILKPASQSTPVGSAQRISGRLVPRALFQTDSDRAAVAKAIVAGYKALSSSKKTVQFYSTGPPARISGKDTGVNTAWRSSLWEVILANEFSTADSQALKDQYAQDAHVAVDPLRALTPGGGCYYNEADVLEEDWKTAFFGANYAKLLSIKQKYDPNNMFIVWKGVGWEEQQGQDAFTCYQKA
ncbi:unnamed protein product [Tilletia controversa]|uniref:FAD-binding PCMH-type domain-containing protein n=1 Tax=Tilletia controversa TaxID=13291 RepID=A0A8X7MVT3_9BASI|nr:hypothetical protein A4X06_0g3200 [Tilletia controversa]CAD6904284.1 unnamed protein product [Tilletia controversa]CAD6922405.1 unnamed protein product [Tilletia controversa]CAD6943223.1 unnamed protein product [Tilletia controversa]CAD6977337.1 unnamed protein product [Tilletia controversa]